MLIDDLTWIKKKKNFNMDFVLPNKNLNKLVIRFYFYKKLLIVIKVKYDITTPNLFNLLFQKDSPSKCGHIN